MNNSVASLNRAIQTGKLRYLNDIAPPNAVYCLAAIRAAVPEAGRLEDKELWEIVQETYQIILNPLKGMLKN